MERSKKEEKLVCGLEKKRRSNLRICDVPGPGRGSSFEETALVRTRVEDD